MKINLVFIGIIATMFIIPLTGIIFVDYISQIPLSVIILFGCIGFMPFISGLLYLSVKDEAKNIDERVN